MLKRWGDEELTNRVEERWRRKGMGKGLIDTLGIFGANSTDILLPAVSGL